MKRTEIREMIRRHPELKRRAFRNIPILENLAVCISTCPCGYGLEDFCVGNGCTDCWMLSVLEFYKKNPLRIKENEL